MDFNVNLLAVLASGIAAYVVGALWYTVFFGKKWKALMGFTDQDMKGMRLSMAQAMSGGFVATMVFAYVLAVFLNTFPGVDALTVAFFAWLGFVATTMSNVVWYEGRPWGVYLINASHYLVAFLLAAWIYEWVAHFGMGTVY